MLRLAPLAALLLCCSPGTGDPEHTGEPAPELVARPGPVVVLSQPSGGLHHHATLAWGEGAFAVAWVTGFEPETGCWAQRFDPAGVGLEPPVQLHDPKTYCDKPDVARVPGGYLVAFDDRRGAVWLRPMSDAGALSAATLLHDAALEVDAVDLALTEQGGGVAIWTQSGAPWMGPDDGEIAWRPFDADAVASGPVLLAEQSSRKTSDAAPLSDGGFVAVWARHHDHPTQPGEVLYEVHGRLYPAGGVPHSFRADDLDGAWPSRPAVAVQPGGGRLAVSWRDKTASAGTPAGAYGRILEPGGDPLGPSVALGPRGPGVGDGDRVVVAWAGSVAVFAWEETGPDGLPGVWLSALDGQTSAILVDRLAISEPGGDRDERPSIAVRPVEGGHEVMVVWETVRPGSMIGSGLRARSVVLSAPR